MKLSFTTLGCPDWSFEKILDEARRMGFPAIEIRGLEGKMLADEIEFFKPGRQQDTKRMLKAHGVEMCAFGSSINFHDPEKLPAMLEEGRRAIDVCQNMGIPHIRVFGDRIPEGRTADEAAQLAADGIRQLCAYADGADVDILLEVHGNFNTIEVMKSLLEKLDDPHFGILWDIEHSDKIYGDNFLPFYETVKSRLRHVHVKDHVRMPDGTFKLCHVGDGDIPIAAIVKKLIEDGFDGYFSLEWEKKWHPELPDCDTEFPFYHDFMENCLK